MARTTDPGDSLGTIFAPLLHAVRIYFSQDRAAGHVEEGHPFVSCGMSRRMLLGPADRTRTSVCRMVASGSRQQRREVIALTEKPKKPEKDKAPKKGKGKGKGKGKKK